MSIERELAKVVQEMRQVASSFASLSKDALNASRYINSFKYSNSGNGPNYKSRLNRIEAQQDIDMFMGVMKKSNRLSDLDRLHSRDHRVISTEDYDIRKGLADRELKLISPSAYKIRQNRERYGKFASDAARIENLELQKEAGSHIDSLLNPQKYRDDQGMERWGVLWNTVKAAEDKAKADKLTNDADSYIDSLTDANKYRDDQGRKKWGAEWSRVKSVEDRTKLNNQSNDADSYIDSLLNQKKYRDDQGRKKWGTNWDRVKLAEDRANTRAVIMNTLGLNKLTALMKTPFGAYAAPFMAAYAGIKASDYMYKKETEATRYLYDTETKPRMELSDKGKAVFNKYKAQALTFGLDTKELSDVVGIWDKHNSLAKFGGDPKLMEAAARLGMRIGPETTFEQFRSEVQEAIKRHGNKAVQEGLGINGNKAMFLNQNGVGTKTYEEMNDDERRIRKEGFEKYKEYTRNETYDKEGFWSGFGQDLNRLLVPDSMEFELWNRALDKRILRNRAKKKGIKVNSNPTVARSFFDGVNATSNPFYLPADYEYEALYNGLKLQSSNAGSRSVNIDIGGVNVSQATGDNAEAIADEAARLVNDAIINALSGQTAA